MHRWWLVKSILFTLRSVNFDIFKLEQKFEMFQKAKYFSESLRNINPGNPRYRNRKRSFRKIFLALNDLKVAVIVLDLSKITWCSQLLSFQTIFWYIISSPFCLSYQLEWCFYMLCVLFYYPVVTSCRILLND